MLADLNEAPRTCNGERMQFLLEAIARTDAGADPQRIANEFKIPQTELQHAFETYHEAGRLAVANLVEEPWLQAHIAFTDWTRADRSAVTHLAPKLDELCDGGPAWRWWFIRKHPHWRIRVLAVDHETRDELAQRLASIWKNLAETSIITSWQWTVYEPEIGAFGGPIGIEAAHELFTADSRHILDYCAAPDSPMGPRETSIMLCSRLFLAAGLDWFEMGDVWQRVAALRPRPADAPPERILALAGDLKPLLQLATRSRAELFGMEGPLHYLASWEESFAQTGTVLGAAATAGNLQRGLRAVMAHHVIFHWNRFGFTSDRQALLAHAAATALLDLE
jgi:thiopeptide-type bacteriocin biosynthesis protein